MMVLALVSMASARGNLTFEIDIDGSPYNALTNSVYSGALVTVGFADDNPLIGDLGPSDLKISVDSGTIPNNFWWNVDSQGFQGPQPDQLGVNSP